MTQTAWLIEWPATDQLPVRYWHPTTGFMIDPHKAIWFARKQDADDMAQRDGLRGHSLRSAEHIFGLSLTSALSTQPHETDPSLSGEEGLGSSRDHAPNADAACALRAALVTQQVQP